MGEFRLGIDRLLADQSLLGRLKKHRVALLAHPASLTSYGQPTLDGLFERGLNVTSVFGPQHGMKGDKQDNMIESADYVDPIHKIPVFSLYGKTRRPIEDMLNHFDVILIDLQDLGTRIYTYLTTMIYMLEACGKGGKMVWVLDRPNPAGRPVEGPLLKPDWYSFVGAAPVTMRHGMTLGELAQWYCSRMENPPELEIVGMEHYDPNFPPGYGWPLSILSWVNPSPNASSLNMARCYPGTVLVEGTTLSEGRGTTIPLEVVGGPDIDTVQILNRMRAEAEDWLQGALLRPCYFEPWFHKHTQKLCQGIQIHTDNKYYRHETFRPYRIIALFFKCLRLEYPTYPLWRDFEYEYEKDRLAIDLINGSPSLRSWVDDSTAPVDLFEDRLTPDENLWLRERESFLLY